MIDLDANDLLLFARVAEVGSFSRAADRLRLPKSTVSRRIAALEKRLGERLVNRSSRKLTITDFGVHVLEHARAVATEVDGALALAQHRQAKPSGRLRVSLLADLAASALPEMLANFVREHPAIVLEMDLSSRRGDLIGENYDLAVRVGESLEDSDLSARKLAELNVGLYASPDYLRRAGKPEVPDDLLRLHGLLLQTRTGDPRGWTLERGQDPDKERWSGTPQQYSIANSPAVLMRMAQADFGVVSVPEYYAREAVQQGLLTQLLPEWHMPAGKIWAVLPGRRLMPARTRAFLDALVATLGDDSDTQART